MPTYFLKVFIGLFISSWAGESFGNSATCGLTKRDGVNAFILRSNSPKGNIPLIHIQQDTNRKLPITSTVLHDKLNLIQNVKRFENFREVECAQLTDKQENCEKYFTLSASQKSKIKAEENSWDRGHLTPVNPMRFSDDAVNTTFYCVNIAPQEPWSNRCAWYAVEERVLTSAHNFSAFVMTGLCPANNAIDGETHYGQKVPDCFWKMACYIDPKTNKTQVVSFIQDNTLIPYELRAEARPERTRLTTTPRSQLEVINIMGKQGKYINSAWRAAAKDLIEGRDPTQLPTAANCIRAKTIPDDDVEQWKLWRMKAFTPSRFVSPQVAKQN